MAVPENIRKVPRPVNTIVEDNGKDGAKRRQFYQLRANAVISNHHIAIGGTLKQKRAQ